VTEQSPTLPRKLAHSDVRDGFASGAAELDEWLIKYAYVNLRANNATTYVTRYGGRVVGYYAITMAAVERDAAPARLQQNRPRQIPCLLLARLAVDRSMQGRGLGAGLLRDALERAVLLSASVGAAAALLHARDEAARDFYLSNGDFLASPLDDLQLLAPMKDLRSILR
jgi:GNAT superfamily N-acetyltransferase